MVLTKIFTQIELFFSFWRDLFSPSIEESRVRLKQSLKIRVEDIYENGIRKRKTSSGWESALIAPYTGLLFSLFTERAKIRERDYFLRETYSQAIEDVYKKIALYTSDEQIKWYALIGNHHPQNSLSGLYRVFTIIIGAYHIAKRDARCKEIYDQAITCISQYFPQLYCSVIVEKLEVGDPENWCFPPDGKDLYDIYMKLNAQDSKMALVFIENLSVLCGSVMEAHIKKHLGYAKESNQRLISQGITTSDSITAFRPAQLRVNRAGCLDKIVEVCITIIGDNESCDATKKQFENLGILTKELLLLCNENYNVIDKVYDEYLEDDGDW